MGLASDIGEHRELRSIPFHLVQHRRKLLARRSHELRMERAGGRKRYRALHAKLLRDLRRFGNGLLGAGKHLLRGGIHVGDGATRSRAEFVKLRGGRTHYRDHAGRRRSARLLHEAPARLKHRKRSVKVENSGSAKGAPLAERKPGRAGKGNSPLFLQCAKRGAADNEYRRLTDVRLGKFLRRAFETRLLQVEPKNGVRLVEKGHGLGIGLGEVLAHAGHLCALASEYAAV